MLEAVNLSVRFGTGSAATQALRGVSASFRARAVTVIMGPSGSGKTTLLSVLGCLLQPDAGKVWLNGNDVTALSESRRAALRQSQIGFVFQAFRLFHALPALDNAAISGQIRGFGQREARQRAKQLLHTLGLEGKLHLKPGQLSGGEKQRVAIARALLLDPPLILADEPTAALDSAAAAQVGSILRSLAHVEGKTVVVVSHDARWQSLADDVICLADGRIATQPSEGFRCA